MLVQPYNKVLKVKPGDTLLKILESNSIYLQNICGGQGLCGKCKVIVGRGRHLLNTLTQSEINFLSNHEIKEGYRLACRATVIHAEVKETDIQLYIPVSSRFTKQVLLINGKGIPVKLEPNIRKVIIKPSIKYLDKLSTEELIKSFIMDLVKEEIILSHESLNEISKLDIRKLPSILTVTIIGNEIVEIKPKSNKDMYGIAIDIGTTKIAAYLIDINTGKVVKADAIMNPQIPFGEDVISRLTYILREESGFERLRAILLREINNMINRLCSHSNIKEESVYEAVVVGNTLMHHIFFNLCPKSLGYAPYIPVTRRQLYLKASSLGLKINPNGFVYSPSLIGGFIGADAVADIIASGLYDLEGNYLLMDIGTNTEIILKKKDTILACSAASGPAFEGMLITCGMRAAPGAIEAVTIDDSLEPKLRVISNEKPIGLTGSGIIDLIAELLKAGILRTDGSFNLRAGSNRIRKNARGMLEFVVVYKELSGCNRDIVITQEDIRQIQLAKAAICAGIHTLMSKLDLKLDDLNGVFIAGSFGFHVNPQSAKRIGLYPDIDLNKIVYLGNAAGFGARLLLLSRSLREKAARVATEIKQIELAGDREFEKEFLRAIRFPCLNNI